jgi:hypothetical protein
MAKNLIDAIRERRERATEVSETYQIHYAGCQCWVVRYPGESEGDEDRCYLVDMVRRSCTCPDFWGYCQEREIDCKHIGALVSDWEQLTGLKWVHREVYLPEDATAYKIVRDKGKDKVVDMTGELTREKNLGWISSPDDDDPFAY